jgi:hypothetical protein
LLLTFYSFNCLLISIIEPEKKRTKEETSIYLRYWKPDEYELEPINEILLEGDTYESLIKTISTISDIPMNNLEILKVEIDLI